MSKPIDQEREAFNREYDAICSRPITQREIAWRMWQARASVQPAGGAVPKADIVAWLNTATGDTTTHEVAVMDWDDENEPVQSLMTVEQHSQIVAAMLAAAPHPVSGEQTVDQHNAAYWQEQYELLRKDYQRSLDERAQDVAGLVEAVRDYLSAVHEQLPNPLKVTAAMLQMKKALAAHRAQQGEQP